MQTRYMREILAKKYSPNWVSSKDDRQIYTIYQRLLAKRELPT